MKFPVVIRQSPLLLLKRIIQVEFVTGLVLFLLSFLANYEDIYLQSPIGGVFRYDIFLVLGSSVLQLAITCFVFLSWHSEEYRLKERDIIHRKGFLLTREQSLILKNISSVEYKRGFLELMMGYGTILLHRKGGEKPMKISSVETPEAYANIIKEAIDLALDRKPSSDEKISILDLILEGEHSHLEFKQTFRYDAKTKDVSKNLEKAAIKTVAAFLNSTGGTLLMGVADNGSIYGMEGDYHTLVRKDRDGFENHFNQVIKNTLGAGMRQYVSISFERIEDRDVCLVRVEPSERPAYLKSNGEEEFFIRTGNSTTALKISEVNSYIETHWKK